MISAIKRLWCKHEWNIRPATRVEKELLYSTAFKQCNKCGKHKYFVPKTGYKATMIVTDEGETK